MGVEPFGLTGHLLDGQYRVERPIGEGGFSVVYKGLHQGLGEPIAIKCLKLAASLDTEGVENFTRRFRDEGRLLYRLGQGNLDIVRVIISGTTVAPSTGALVPYMVLEWLEGQPLSLDLKLRRDRKLGGRSLNEVVSLFEPGAIALDHAHKQGVVHRDVKPGNLFLAKSAMYGMRMKVLDFGLAKILDDTIGITLAATMGGLMMCSPRYAAPEQFDPKIGAIGPWTDVYSLTMVLLEALRDTRVRTGDGIVGCMSEAIDPKVNITPQALGLRLPRGVEIALSRAVCIDVRQRQKSAGELWGEIKAGLQAAPPAYSAPAAGPPQGLGTTVAMAPPSHGPASHGPTSQASDTLVDPVYSVPTGLGGTLMMDPPARPSASGPAAPLPAAGRPASAALPPGYMPASQYRSQPPPNVAPTATVGMGQPYAMQAQAARGYPSAPAAAPVRPPAVAPPPRSSRTGLVVFILLVVLAGSGALGFYGWRWWVMHRAVSATLPG